EFEWKATGSDGRPLRAAPVAPARWVPEGGIPAGPAAPRSHRRSAKSGRFSPAPHRPATGNRRFQLYVPADVASAAPPWRWRSGDSRRRRIEPPASQWLNGKPDFETSHPYTAAAAVSRARYCARLPIVFGPASTWSRSIRLTAPELSSRSEAGGGQR